MMIFGERPYELNVGFSHADVSVLSGVALCERELLRLVPEAEDLRRALAASDAALRRREAAREKRAAEREAGTKRRFTRGRGSEDGARESAARDEQTHKEISDALGVVERRIAEALSEVHHARLILLMDRFIREAIVPLLVAREVLARYETAAELRERDFVQTLEALYLCWYSGGTAFLEYPLLGTRLHDGHSINFCAVWHALQAPYLGEAAENVRARIRAAGLTLAEPAGEARPAQEVAA